MDYEVTVTVRNKKFLRMMKSKGIETLRELHNQTGVPYTTLGNIANLKISAYHQHNGELRESVETICSFFNCDPSDIFPKANLYQPLLKSKVTYEATLESLVSIGTTPKSLLIEDANKAINKN